MKVVVFDLDGTLVESHEDVWDSIEYAFDQIGCDFTADFRQDNTNLKLKPQEILYTFCPDVSEEKEIIFLRTLRRHYISQGGFKKTRMYPGIKMLLEDLRSGGLPLFIATLKSQQSTSSLLEAKRLSRYFKGVYSPDSFQERKEKWQALEFILEKYDLPPEESLMIGDSATDLMAAHRVSMRSIGVTWGYGETQELMDQNPEKIVESVKGLKDYLFRMM